MELNSNKKQLTAGPSPDWLGFPEIWPEFAPSPTKWSGMTLTWDDGRVLPPPVFIGQLTVPPRDESPVQQHQFVFGYRVDLAHALRDGKPLPDVYLDGFFPEYAVVEYPAGNVHWLRQRNSVTYSSTSEADDFLPAADLPDLSKLCINITPSWKTSEANWPTHEGEPMFFVGQLDLPKNAVTQQFLTWNHSTHLFWAPSAPGSVFKITSQDAKSQTAKESITSSRKIVPDAGDNG